jgi:hypothetical protein
MTEAGTMVGKPVTAIVVAALAFKLFLTKLRLFIFYNFNEFFYLL